MSAGTSMVSATEPPLSRRVDEGRRCCRVIRVRKYDNCDMDLAASNTLLAVRSIPPNAEYESKGDQGPLRGDLRRGRRVHGARSLIQESGGDGLRPDRDGLA